MAELAGSARIDIAKALITACHQRLQSLAVSAARVQQDMTTTTHLGLQVALRRGQLQLPQLLLLRGARRAGVPVLLLRLCVCALPGRGLHINTASCAIGRR